MKPRRAFNLHPSESASAAIGRMYRYIRQIKHDYQPQSHYAERQQMKKSQRHLHLVKR